MSRSENSRFANRKAAHSYKSKFATNLLLFRFWRGWWLVCVPCQSLEGSEIKLVTKHAVTVLEKTILLVLHSSIYSYQYSCIKVHLQNHINASGKIYPGSVSLLNLS